MVLGLVACLQVSGRFLPLSVSDDRYQLLTYLTQQDIGENVSLSVFKRYPDGRRFLKDRMPDVLSRCACPKVVELRYRGSDEIHYAIIGEASDHEETSIVAYNIATGKLRVIWRANLNAYVHIIRTEKQWVIQEQWHPTPGFRLPGIPENRWDRFINKDTRRNFMYNVRLNKYVIVRNFYVVRH